MSCAGFANALGWRRILLVLEEVWRDQDFRWFLNHGPNTTRLIATRIDRVVPEANRAILGAMTSQEGTRLVAPGLLPEDQEAMEKERLSALSERVGK